MAVAASTAIAAPAGRAPASTLARFVLGAPELVAAGVAGFGVAPMVLLLAGHFTAPLVLPLGVAGAAAAMVVCGAPARPADRRAVALTLVAIGIALGWFVANAFYSAQDVFAHRDPATYGLTARWLMQHGSLPVPTHPEIFGAPGGYVDTSAGFGANGFGSVYSQGNHLLPALLAPAGWVFGTAGMLKANVAIGALALLAFFGLARRVVGEASALVAMCALAVSIPMIFVSRDTYSEPLALLLLIGGLGLLHRAVASGRIADFALAGFVAGSAAMARIDSDVSLLALIVAGAVLLAVAAPAQRRMRAWQVGALLGAALSMTLLGWADVTRLSSGYYRDERHQILPIGWMAVALALLGGVVVVIVWRPGLYRRLRASVVRTHVYRWAGVAVFAGVGLLVSRPLWLVTHGKPNPSLAGIQAQLGLAVDGTRTYNEHTVNWLAMYYGWPAVGLAVIGYVVLLRRLILRREYALVGVLAMGAAMSALYLWSAEITPDQPWAIRRYVPVVIPVLLVAAAATLRELWRRRSRLLRAIAVAGGAAVLVVPLLVTLPVAGLREEVPQLSQVRAICAATGPDGALVAVDGSAQVSYLQTIRSYCDVPAIGLVDAAPAQLATVRAAVAAHGRTLYVLSTDAAAMHFVGAAPPPFSTVTTSRWPSVIDTSPRHASAETVTVYLGTVRPDGLSQPVTARS